MNAWLVIVILALSVGGCSEAQRGQHEPQPPPTKSVSAEDHRAAYLAIVRQEPSLATETDEQLVGVAQDMCLSLKEDRFTPKQVLDILNQATNGAGYSIMGAGISAFCPDQMKKVGMK